MRIVETRERTIALEGAVTNAVVSFADHTVSLVALVSDQMRDGRPVIGFGFNSIGRFAQGGILRERMFPRLHAAEPATLLDEDSGTFDAAAIAATAMRNEKPGGHGDRAGALGALELAVWDLNAKLRDEPAYRTIARHFGRSIARRPSPVYAAGGYYHTGHTGHTGDSKTQLREELKAYSALGFDSFKIKIGGASLEEDLERIEIALGIAGHGSRLSVDANGRFDSTRMIEYGRAIEKFDLRWYEEPGDPIDYAANRALCDCYAGAIATGENLFSVGDAQNLVRFAGMRPGKDIFQMDAGLSYGLTEYSKMLVMLEANGFDRAQCFPHGGHLINLHISIGLGLGGCEAYPGVFQPFGGYPSECDIGEGLAWPTDAPGFGLEQKRELRPHLDALIK